MKAANGGDYDFYREDPLPPLRGYFPQRGKIISTKSSPSGGSGPKGRRGRGLEPISPLPVGEGWVRALFVFFLPRSPRRRGPRPFHADRRGPLAAVSAMDAPSPNPLPQGGEGFFRLSSLPVGDSLGEGLVFRLKSALDQYRKPYIIILQHRSPAPWMCLTIPTRAPI